MLAANSVVVMGWEFMQVDILVENMVSVVIPARILVGTWFRLGCRWPFRRL